MANVLIVDDDEGMCYTLANMVRQAGHDAVSVNTLSDGLQTVFDEAFDTVFLDVQMPDGNGLEALPKIAGAPSKPEVIIITGQGDPDGAELAIQSGAWDYIEKPATINAMILPFLRALQYREGKGSTHSIRAIDRKGIIGESAELRACLNVMAQAGSSDATVLLSGETGTGKELFAAAIHRNSRRKHNAYVIVDCAALPETLVESTLFGHVKGAFTGADSSSEGLIKHADGGTLLLDEMGELPLPVQKKFLRVLQEHTFRPVGSKKEIESDFRLLASTNRDLDRMVKEGLFRKDLLFRLRSLSIVLPPLRERRGDVNDLVMHYTAKLCSRYDMDTKGMSPEFLEALSEYDWPGNVRELVQTVESALAVSGTEPTLHPKHLPDSIRIQLKRSSVRRKYTNEDESFQENMSAAAIPSLKDFRSSSERRYLQRLLRATHGNPREACRVAGISRSSLYNHLRKHGISASD